MIRRFTLDEMAPRFWARVAKAGPDDCWEWTAVRDRHGYGQVYFDGKTHRAHRLALRLSGIELVPGMDTDHLCRNRACVNPRHLEQVTHRTNAQRGEAGAHERAKTHCPKGHAYDEANTYLRRKGHRIERGCRACLRLRTRAYYRRLRPASCIK